ncbi:UNVERIFIED_CONTAM: hypothetical protein HDU68_001470 [Siphonaria sp. JEL0065]|nr:hypothetical protein HDU68_001470 [Siphonaria sp. JEL0065]
MSQEPRYVIVNGAPKTDYTGNIDLVMNELTNELSYEAIQVLGVSGAATSFDFRALSTIENQSASIITELGALEKVFYIIIEKFSIMVKSNHEVNVRARVRKSSARLTIVERTDKSLV